MATDSNGTATPGTVDISIGPAIPSQGRKPTELMREVEAWIEAEMLRLDPEAYPDGEAKLSVKDSAA